MTTLRRLLMTRDLRPSEVPLSDAWKALRHLLDRLRVVGHRSDWLVECLDTLVSLLGADRGLVLVREAGGDHVLQARGNGGQLDAQECHEVSQTIIRVARETGQCRVWEVGDDGSESLAHLGIVTAAAAPLFPVGGDGPPIGALYVDFRVPRRVLDGTAVELLTAAADMVSVLLDRERALTDVRNALVESRFVAEGPSLSELLTGESMDLVRVEVASLSEDTPVLVTGESGTGKTLLCRALAASSARRPIIRALLGASDDLNTITSELFGHERGAFSGATSRRVGLVEQADGGTLILDEVLSFPHHAQQLLLDLTQFGTYRPLGWTGREPKCTKFRLISATNGDLEEAMREGRFREDLYYRLAGARLHLPPLRDRRQDIVPLAQGILARLDPERGWRLSVDLRRRLSDASLRWPGNLRQLEMTMRRAHARALAEDAAAELLGARHVLDHDLGAPGSPPETPSGTSTYLELQARRELLDKEERELFERVLARHDHVVARAARALGMPRTSLISRMERLGLQRLPARRGRPPS